MGPNGRLWSGINVYIAGLDVPTPSEGRSERYMAAARTIEQNLDLIQIKQGNDWRTKNIRHG